MRWPAFGLLFMAILPHLAGAGAGPFGDQYSGIPYDDPRFVGWIADVIQYEQPDPGSGGFSRCDNGLAVSPAEALRGKPADFSMDALNRHVLSLGNGGSVVLVFDRPLANGPGPDFAVFENGFTDQTDWMGSAREGSEASYFFAELAAVEVASHTGAWARFPITTLHTNVLYNLNHKEKNRFCSQDVTLLDGLAGKHTHTQGTPFDLSDLENDPLVLAGEVDLNRIRYVRLVDVVGDGSLTDAQERPVYDPYYDFQSGYPHPAPPSALDGFDLRAVGVIHFAPAELAIRREREGVLLEWFALAGRYYRIQESDPGTDVWRCRETVYEGENHWIRVYPDTGTERLLFRLQSFAEPP